MYSFWLKSIQWFMSCPLHKITTAVARWPWLLPQRPSQYHQCHLNLIYYLIAINFAEIRPFVHEIKVKQTHTDEQTDARADHLTALCLLMRSSVATKLFDKRLKKFYRQPACCCGQLCRAFVSSGSLSYFIFPLSYCCLTVLIWPTSDDIAEDHSTVSSICAFTTRLMYSAVKVQGQEVKGQGHSVT